jgi:hypothetical protein
MSRRPLRVPALLAAMAIVLAVVSASWVRAAAEHDMPCCASAGHCETPALGEPCCPSGQPPATPASPTLTTPGKPGFTATVGPGTLVVPAGGPCPPSSWATFHQGRFRPAHDPPYLLNVSLRI